MSKILTSISSFFLFKERSTTFKKEILGGLSTFLAMAYILAVNPSMLSNANGGHDYAGVFFLGTAISAFVATLAMGLYAKVPVALAPGMGVNAFFAYTVAGNIMGLQVENALIATFVSGILYAIIAMTPVRHLMAKLLPKNIKIAIGAMIGLFLAFIGLNDSGIIVSDSFSINAPGSFITSATKTKFGNIADPFVIIAIITVLLVFVLHFLKIKGGALIAMVAAVIMVAIAYGAGVTDAKNAFHIQSYDSFSKFPELGSKMWSSVGSSLSNGKIYIAIFVFLYVDFFDTTGTLFAIDHQANLSKTDAKWMKKANTVDAFSTIFGSTMLTSTTTSFSESSVGVSQGARTGFASVITGTLFGLAIAMWPIMSPILPIEHALNGVAAQNSPFSPTVMPVTGPILILVGSLMLSQLKHFEWSKTIDIPVLFISLIIGTLSFSISTGIAAAMILYFFLNASQLVYLSIKNAKGKVTDEDEEGNKINIKSEIKRIKSEVLNPMTIGMTLIALTYFISMIWWAY